MSLECLSTRPGMASRLSLAMNDQTTPRDTASDRIEPSRDPSGDRLTVTQAARRLGVTPDAVRKRIKRNSIDWDTDHDGRVRVYVDDGDGRRDGYRDQSRDDGDASRDGSGDGMQDASRESLDGYRIAIDSKSETIEDLRDQLDFMRRELERKDAILLRMAERLPAIEAPVEPRDDSETVSPRSDGGVTPEDNLKPVEHRSWWRRFFGFV